MILSLPVLVEQAFRRPAAAVPPRVDGAASIQPQEALRLPGIRSAKGRAL